MNVVLGPYVEREQSGIPWFADIPAHWQVKRLRHVTSCLDSQRIPLNGPERSEKPGPYPYWGANQVIDHVGSWLFDEALVLLGEDGAPFFDKLRAVAFSVRGKIWVNNHAHVLRPRNIVPEYLAHVLNITDYQAFVEGSTRDKLTQQAMKDIPVLAPPMEEQRQVALFLDHLQRRINRLIRAKRRLIELLNEQKQAIIQRAVTRGVDPNVRLKPTGVEWLGDVPEHWDVRRSRFVLREIDKRSTTGNETHLSMSQRFGLIPSDQIAERRLTSESYVGGKLVEVGDLVLNRLKAHLGVFALAKQAGVISPDYTVLRLSATASPEYFEYVWRTPACRTELVRRAKGIVQGFWRLYTGDLYDIQLPVPPVREQQSIVEFASSSSQQLNLAIDRAWREIDLIREYRARLIADVVTGKLDVRGVELPPLDDEDESLADGIEDDAELPDDEDEGDADY